MFSSGPPGQHVRGLQQCGGEGAVYSCPWRSSAACQQLLFDNSDDRRNSEGAQMEFKSKQWFGASVRSDGEHILACAPLYQCRPSVSLSESLWDVLPEERRKSEEQQSCGGRTRSFYWQGQLISDDVSEILTRAGQDFITPYANSLTTISRGQL
ncbi:hypothetical protein INR49_005947 [Caranx melampygus]|nr:hypothetical protein INR49_005947 [Caranx melampygus]